MIKKEEQENTLQRKFVFCFLTTNTQRVLLINDNLIPILFKTGKERDLGKTVGQEKINLKWVENFI